MGSRPAAPEPAPPEPPRWRLLISCADRAGIVATVASFLAARGANITSSAQHSTDPGAALDRPRQRALLMRMEYVIAHGDPAALEAAFAHEVSEPFSMQWRIFASVPHKRIAILISREDPRPPSAALSRGPGGAGARSRRRAR